MEHLSQAGDRAVLSECRNCWGSWCRALGHHIPELLAMLESASWHSDTKRHLAMDSRTNPVSWCTASSVCMYVCMYTYMSLARRLYISHWSASRLHTCRMQLTIPVWSQSSWWQMFITWSWDYVSFKSPTLILSPQHDWSSCSTNRNLGRYPDIQLQYKWYLSSHLKTIYKLLQPPWPSSDKNLKHILLASVIYLD
jgi:hypothetical protein